MAKIIPANRKRNLLWPLLRVGKGYVSGIMGKRYESALRSLVRTPRGSIVWSPEFGTMVYLLRTQQASEEMLTFVTTDLQGSIGMWIPDIELITVDFDKNPDTEKVEVQIVWGIPNATSLGAGPPSESSFAFGPINTTITI